MRKQIGGCRSGSGLGVEYRFVQFVGIMLTVGKGMRQIGRAQ